MKEIKLTEGNILKSLIGFAFPVLLALLLQAMYGAVDLIVVGKFAEVADQSGVATGNMFTGTVANLAACFAIGITVTVGEAIGSEDRDLAGRAIGCGLALFAIISVLLTVVFVPGAGVVATWMHAPAEAHAKAAAYIRICCAGSVFTVAYNLIGSVFRGLGDSKTPLATVAIACAVNIGLDLFFIAGLGMGASGAAYATILAQAVSVVLSLAIIMRKQLPFDFKWSLIRLDRRLASKLIRIGTPVAFQELLVGFSFIYIQARVNTLGVVESAAIGVGEKSCAFLMLVASAYMQSMAAFVAQNLGAGKPDRARKGLLYGIETAFICGMCTGAFAFFCGDILAAVFSKDAAVIAAAHEYLKAYAVDCLLTGTLFCFIGYFNGREHTMLVMIQGIIGAFCVRVPAVFIFSRMAKPSLFMIGLATPMSSVVQILIFLAAYWWIERRERR